DVAPASSAFVERKYDGAPSAKGMTNSSVKKLEKNARPSNKPATKPCQVMLWCTNLMYERHATSNSSNASMSDACMPATSNTDGVAQNESTNNARSHKGICEVRNCAHNT